jgi:hypothetical protein
MQLTELKILHVSQLLEMAASLEIENTQRMRKQELMFAILKNRAKNGETVFSTVSRKYNTAFKYAKEGLKIERGDIDFYKYCGIIIRELTSKNLIVPETINEMLVEHLLDSIYAWILFCTSNHAEDLEKFDNKFDNKLFLENKGCSIFCKRISARIFLSKTSE